MRSNFAILFDTYQKDDADQIKIKIQEFSMPFCNCAEREIVEKKILKIIAILF